MAERLKGLLDSARAKIGGLLGGFNEYHDAFNDRAYSLLGNAPQQFNAGAGAGTAGSVGDAAYIARLPEYMLKGSMPDARTIPGTSDYIAAQAGIPAPQGFLENAAWIGGQLLAPGPGEIGAAGMAGGKLAMFLGAKAKTAMPDVLEYAQAMEKAGKSADEIWQTTGKLGQPWMKGADGKWRFEISDKYDFVDTPEGGAEVGANIRSGADSLAGPLGRGDTPSITLAQLMKHDELYGAYPDLRKVDVRMTPESGGQYAATFDRIRLNNDDLKRLGSPQTTDDIQKPSSIALHEVQHAIQEREAFGSGGSIGGNGAPSIYSGQLVDSLSQRAKALEKQLDSMDYLSPEHSALQKEYYAIKDRIEGAAAFEGYKRLAGEAEARNVQARMNMSMDERLTLPPWVTQDVPTEQQIVRFGDGPAMAIEDFAARRAGKAKPYKEAMRVLYRGSNDSGESIKGGIAEGALFAAANEKVAQSYAGTGGNVERIGVKPDAKILVEGSPEYATLTGRRRGKLINTMRKGENIKTAADDVARLAREAGYDAVEFTSMEDMGIAIFNPDKFIRGLTE